MKFIVANSPPSKGFFIEAFKLTDQVCLGFDGFDRPGDDGRPMHSGSEEL